MEGFFMSDLPNDPKQKSQSNTDASGSSESEKSTEPTAMRETVRERIKGEIRTNPRWSEAKPSGKGFVIVGARSPMALDEFMKTLSDDPLCTVHKPSGKGYVIGGAKPSSGNPDGFETLLTTLRQDEPALGSLSLADQNWLAVALAHLIQIDESRRAENAHGSSYCIFEVGRAYFQCLAPSFGTYLRCESVSEKFVPEIGAIITPEKRDRLVREFGFTVPGYSKNFSQKIEVKAREDLAYVARMAFRVLRDIYDVKDFGATKFKLTLAKPSRTIPEVVSLPIQIPAEPTAETPYAVFVDDNFHHMNEDERYKDGDYATLEEAVSKCRRIVDDCLAHEHKPGMSSTELYDRYCSFGEDPFIRGPGCDFSAWAYARQRCDEICRNQNGNNS
jgi:hypothetical protein